MDDNGLTLQTLWADVGFKPNPNQEKAIRHVDGPLYLTAGPGSGKTRVVLWRTVNLIVFHNVAPSEIFLSTFTEKAAHQLREGLRVLLNIATNYTNQPYDIARMYVGTVHSLCQQLLTDRRFSRDRGRSTAPRLLDALGQYFYLYRTRNWDDLTSRVDLGENPTQQINQFFSGHESLSKHNAVTSCQSFFNRLSEECINPAQAKAICDDPVLKELLTLYEHYQGALKDGHAVPLTDFSLLQQHAYNQLLEAPDEAVSSFKHVIIDEYQDTNTIQEQIFFTLAEGHQNICVVGDDDQALYRFRGATVENFVDFPSRCDAHWGITPRKIALSTNYRSRQQIVSFYTDFIEHCNWEREESPGYYRVADKNIKAHSADEDPAVVATTPGHPEFVCVEVADLVKELLDQGKVQDPNEIAFLFPSLKSTQVPRMRRALEQNGLQVYAPRAGRFLEVEEATDMMGIFLHLFGKLKRGDFPGSDYSDYHNWLGDAHEQAKTIVKSDNALATYIQDRQNEINAVTEDYKRLSQVVESTDWDLDGPYDLATMKRRLLGAQGLSDRAKKGIGGCHFDKIIQKRAEQGNPFSLRYVLRRATSLDWNILDAFYQICGFSHFRSMFKKAQDGGDEAAVCNLSLVSQYLSRFNDEYASVITADLLRGNGFQRLFFGSYLYTLFRLGESEYEDADDPFPKGRIPFLTVHQAKGLEFPVVVLGNPRKDNRGPQRVEEVVRPFLSRDGEPLDRIAEFDIMRMFYVALSRAEKLLVIPYYRSQGNYINAPFREMLAESDVPRIQNFDVQQLPDADPADDSELPKSYSFTADYLRYQTCPRRYMVFRKYDFAPSDSQTQFFGSLVHRTLEDLHEFLIAQRS
jgi:DNA helicase-2/ATP-dependent DNA helicase PcrA